jgi:hypothetical protein
MSGILKVAHLDYWYSHWNGSHSDGSSIDDDQHHVEIDKLEMDGLEGDSEIDSAKDDDPPGREWASSLPDFELNPGILSVEISFIQLDNLDLYIMIELALELSWQTHEIERADLLPDLKEDKAVHLNFEVFAKPGELNKLNDMIIANHT